MIQWKQAWRALRGYDYVNFIKHQQYCINRQSSAIDTLNAHLATSQTQIATGLGRLIAKIDPMYGTSEDDPTRKAESDKLAEATMARLKAEEMARRHTEGKL